MTFQISSLSYAPFAPYFQMSDQELRTRNARRMVVTASPGTPCRVSLADADVGETVVLLNYQHQPADSPYQAAHAIYVRKGVAQRQLAAGEVPEVIRSRPISLRAFDADHMMIDADVVAGEEIEAAINQAFAQEDVSYLHLHFAKPGCFAATVRRVE